MFKAVVSLSAASVLLVSCSCAGGKKVESDPNRPAALLSTSADGVSIASADQDVAVPSEAAKVPVAPPISEVEARQRVSRAFRSAGLRVLHDQVVDVGSDQVTLDGFDPERNIGFEYIAVAERDTDVRADERTRLVRSPQYKLLVIDASDARSVDAAVAKFLATVPQLAAP